MDKTIQCIHCGCQLSITQRVRQNHCGQPKCQQASVRLALLNQVGVKDALAQQVAEECQKHHSSQPNSLLPNVPLSKTPVLLIPANTKQLTELSNTRKEQFLAHLSATIDTLESDEQAPNFPHSVLEDQGETQAQQIHAKLLQNACALCRGHCCRLGAEHGFQDPASLQHYLSSMPQSLSKDEVIAEYQAYLPEQSYEGACVFQGENGCTLPRNMRAITCNKYLCEELGDYVKRLNHNKFSHSFAGAIAYDKVIRVQLISR